MRLEDDYDYDYDDDVEDNDDHVFLLFWRKKFCFLLKVESYIATK